MARADLIERMVYSLRCLDVDLNYERDVIRKLQHLGFISGDIIACVDEVTAETRRQGLKRSWIV